MITYYKSNKVGPATDIPSGFLATDRSANPSYERVPYAFDFRTPDNNLDFVLISVHLAPGAAEDVLGQRRYRSPLEMRRAMYHLFL